MIKRTRAKQILTGLFLILLGIVLYDIIFPPFKLQNLKEAELKIDMVEFNLRLLNKYNTPREPLSSNFRDFFNGEYSLPAYSIIRYNVISSLFLLVVPLLFMLGVLLFLEASFKITVIVMAIFGVFTVLPLFLI